MALATTPAGILHAHKDEIDAARRDAIFGTIVCDYQAVTRAFNRLDAATDNLIALQATQITLLEAMGANLEAKLAEAGIDLKALIRGEYAR